jgi:hypothetical protein
MRYVRYVGPSHQRMILASDWKSVGLTGPTFVWNAQNGFAVPLEHFTEDQIRKAIEPDSTLIVTGEGEDNQDEFVPDLSATRDMTPAELAAPRIDMMGAVEPVEGSTAISEASGGRPVPDMDTRTDQDRLPDAWDPETARGETA